MTRKKCSLCGLKLTRKEIAQYCILSNQDRKDDLVICPDCLLSKTVFSIAVIENERETILANWNKHRLKTHAHPYDTEA